MTHSAASAPPHVSPSAPDSRLAIVENPSGETWTYGQLRRESALGAEALLQRAGVEDLAGARVGVFAPPGIPWVRAVWSVWRAGGVAVPLARMHPLPEIQRTLEDAAVVAVLISQRQEDDPRVLPQALAQALAELPRDDYDVGTARKLPVLGPLDLEALSPREAPDPASDSIPLPSLDPQRPALILYTSGTTGRPKGVVIRHRHLTARTDALRQAWEWSAEDRILNVLPLHHVHGIENVLLCALRSGATWETLPRFDAEAVWAALERGAQARESQSAPLTLFMAVPTVYHRLLAAWRQEPELQARRSDGARRLRLMVSGSAALPRPLLEAWKEATGQTLLERYGMTEIGMALSNPYRGSDRDPRRPGHVGRPLPGVEIRRRGEEGALIDEGSIKTEGANEGAEEPPGELEIRGPGVFDGYWRRPEATAEAFRDGYFVTGDLAVVAHPEGGVPAYRLLGRRSVDILKTAGYKVSALEIETVLLEHPKIAECAVVGLEDEAYGQRVAAAVVLRTSPPQEAGGGTPALTLEELRPWAAQRLAPYKVPSRLFCLPELPRNALGKVTKVPLAEQLEAQLEELAGRS